MLQPLACGATVWVRLMSKHVKIRKTLHSQIMHTQAFASLQDMAPKSFLASWTKRWQFIPCNVLDALKHRSA